MHFELGEDWVNRYLHMLQATVKRVGVAKAASEIDFVFLIGYTRRLRERIKLAQPESVEIVSAMA